MPNIEGMKTAVVGGTSQLVRRSTVVFLSDDFRVLMMSTNASFAPYGIAQNWVRNTPGTPFQVSNEAGSTDEEIMVWTHGAIALAECGNTVTAGKMVTTDTTARVVDSAGIGAAISTAVWDVGLALEDGAAGDVIRVQVMPSIRNPN